MCESRQLWTSMALMCLSLLASAFRAEAVEKDTSEAKTRVLLVTGEDYPGHKWQDTAPALKAELEKHPQLSVALLTDLKQLASARLDKYDAVILHFKNYDPAVPGRQGFDNLAGYVKRGGGLMLVHFSCGAFEEFKSEFAALAGRVWFGQTPPPGRRQHDPRGKFTVNITSSDHPITRGLTDFQTVDELYTCLEGELPVTVLATAVSKVDGKPYPIAFVHHCGKGRVFHCVLGHDVAALKSPGAAELYRRACVWVTDQ